MADLIDRAAVFEKVEEHINMHKDIDWNSYRACLGLHAAIATLPAQGVDAINIADEVFDHFEAKGATAEAFGAAEVGERLRAAIAAYQGEER